MIQAVFPASGNKCGQLAQATFSRIHFSYWRGEKLVKRDQVSKQGAGIREQ
jgi:hypothetical protein